MLASYKETRVQSRSIWQWQLPHYLTLSMRSQSRVAAFVACLALTTFTAVRGATEDLEVYTDSTLAAKWQNWSWNTDINFAATDLFAGTSGSSISVNSTAWAAISLKLEGTFRDYAGLRFDIAVCTNFSHPVNPSDIKNSGRATRHTILCSVYSR